MATPPPSSRRSSALVAAGIFLSRVSGIVRERAIAHFLGAGAAVDAFRAALRIPNVLQNLLGEGVLSASFIPVYSRLLADGDEEEAGRVAGAVAALLLVVSGALVVIGVVFARPLTIALTPGFSGERLALTVTLVRIVFPGIGVLVLSAWCLGVLNSHRRFFLAYVAPVLWSAAQVAVLVAFGLAGWNDARLATALAWGTLVGGALQFLVQLPAVLSLTRGLRLRLDPRREGVSRTLRAFGPVVLGRGVVQLSAYVDLLLASLLATGAVAVLGFAQALYVLPISLFGMSVAAAELPELSTADAGDRAGVARRLTEGLGRIAFFVIATSVAYLVLGDAVVGTLLRTGEFGSVETTVVWCVLAAYTVGLLATTSSRLLQSALYATGDTRTPAKIAAVRVAASAVIGVLLMFQFDRVVVTASGLQLDGSLPAWGPLAPGVRETTAGLRLGAVGLALGAGITAWLEFVWLRHRVRRDLADVPLGGGHLGPLLTAAAAAVATGLGTRLLLGGVPSLATLLVAGSATGATYLVVATSRGVPEALLVGRALGRRR